jgi:4-hydroxy-3-methylbut-2-enyl diphosphate reductase
LDTDDVVMIPAFGAPLPLLEQLKLRGIETSTYNTTCPFVERVWKKSNLIGSSNHTIIIHGKHNHEETRSTFSRSVLDSKAVVVIRNMDEARALSEFILGNNVQQAFEKAFEGKFSTGFDISTHLDKIGVINQTTMLATETQEISDFLKSVMVRKFGGERIGEHMADTRDTLCYATNENQDATAGLLETDADLAIVVGGYNSSNTSHLVELCARKFPTYFIASENEIENAQVIHHYDYVNKKHVVSSGFLPVKDQLKIVITSGASCPDSVMDAVIHKINSFMGSVAGSSEVIKNISTFSSN